eukprot:10009283-Lingulodinium_polyedra.AAC.1
MSSFTPCNALDPKDPFQDLALGVLGGKGCELRGPAATPEGSHGRLFRDPVVAAPDLDLEGEAAVSTAVAGVR